MMIFNADIISELIIPKLCTFKDFHNKLQEDNININRFEYDFWIINKFYKPIIRVAWSHDVNSLKKELHYYDDYTMIYSCAANEYIIKKI